MARCRTDATFQVEPVPAGRVEASTRPRWSVPAHSDAEAREPE